MRERSLYHPCSEFAEGTLCKACSGRKYRGPLRVDATHEISERDILQ